MAVKTLKNLAVDRGAGLKTEPAGTDALFGEQSDEQPVYFTVASLPVSTAAQAALDALNAAITSLTSIVNDIPVVNLSAAGAVGGSLIQNIGGIWTVTATAGDFLFAEAPLDPLLGGTGQASIGATRNALAGTKIIGDLAQYEDIGGLPKIPADHIEGGGGLSAVDFANNQLTISDGVTLSAAHLALIAGATDLDVVTVRLRHASNQASAVTVLVPNNIAANARIRFIQASDQTGVCKVKPETTASTINGDDGDPSGGIELQGAGAQADFYVEAATGSAFTGYLVGMLNEARTIEGATTFSQAVVASSTLGVTGAITATGGIDCNDPVTFDDNVTLDGAGKTFDFGGNTATGNKAKVVTSVTGTLTRASHEGNVLVTSGNITVPTDGTVTNAVVIAGGAHTITFNSTTTVAAVSGQFCSFVFQSATVLKVTPWTTPQTMS